MASQEVPSEDPILRQGKDFHGVLPTLRDLKNLGKPWKLHRVPSGKRLHNYGKSPFFIGKKNYKWI